MDLMGGTKSQASNIVCIVSCVCTGLFCEYKYETVVTGQGGGSSFESDCELRSGVQCLCVMKQYW
jgi:hypothetical protein